MKAESFKSDISLESINNFLVQLAIIVLLLGFPILVVTGQKLHYYIFVLIALVQLIINIQPYFNSVKFYYFLALAIPLVFFLLKKSVNEPFIFSLLPYVIVPFVYFNRSFQLFNLDTVLKIFQVVTILNFIGVLLQVVGFQSIFLDLDRVKTDGIDHDRYGSFAGGTLALGLISSISFIFSLYKIVYERNKSLIQIGFTIISFATLILAQSRRFYILVFIIGVLMFLFDINKNTNINKILRIGLFTFLGLLISLFFLYSIRANNYYLLRLFSIVDFENDGANLERVAKWLLAINSFLNNFWFGMGLGASGTIGKNLTDDDSSVDIFSAESYFIKIFVEGGVIFGVLCLLFLIVYLVKSFKNLQNSQKALAAYIYIFFFLECFMSTSLESAFPSIIFWICVSKLFATNEQTNDEYFQVINPETA